MDRSAWPCLLALVVLGACRTRPYAIAPSDDPFAPEPREDAPPSREWVSLGMWIVDRQADDDDPLDDALGFTIDSAYELALGTVRPAIEIGGSWSNHEVDTPTGKTDLDLVRVSMGARVTFEPPGAFCVPYVRGGVFYRWDLENDTDLEVLDQNGRGHYLGAGLELSIEPGLTLGPAYTWYQGAEDGIEEHFLGLTARFRF